jgi:DNA-binding transcriptional ArsR family regulator
MTTKGAMTQEALEMIAGRFRALGEPLRLRILQELENGEKSVSEITQAVQSTQPNVSKHLKVLQEVGLLVRRQERNTVYYSIGDRSVFEICHLVCESLRERISAQADAFVNSTPARTTRRR